MIVVDTNILAYLWLPSVRSTDAKALLRVDRHWAAPFLWRSELRNVCLGYLRAGSITHAEAEHAIAEAGGSLLAGEYSVRDAAVLTLAIQSKCSSYDCEYVALAEQLRTILVTEDRALLRAFPQQCRSIKQVI